MMNMLRVMKWRGHERYFISSGTRDLIGMMSLLEAPYHLIVSIAELKSKAVLRQRVHGSWNPDLVKRLSREAVEKRPAILVEAQDPQNPLTFKATRMLTESKLALWLTEQNAKGIAVPTSLLRLKYVEMWGMGPHAEKTGNTCLWSEGQHPTHRHGACDFGRSGSSRMPNVLQDPGCLLTLLSTRCRAKTRQEQGQHRQRVESTSSF